MGLPAGVNREQLVHRLQAVRHEADSTVPGTVLSALDAVASQLSHDPPDLPRAGHAAAGVLRWYFDQGFSTVRAQADMGDLALDVVKMDRVTRALAQVRRAQAQPGAPQVLEQAARLLAQAERAFDAQGRLRASSYDDAARKLRDLLHANRETLARAIDPDILAI